MNKADILLFNLIRDGDVSAFEKLFNAYYPLLCIYAKKKVGDLDEARDIVQDVFVKVYHDRDKLAIDTSIKAYLYKAVHNASLNRIKQIKIHKYHHEYIKNQTPFSEDQDTMIKAELEEKIWQIIQSLPDKCRRIFEMNRFEGKKNKEIAENLGISIRTVETQISKALKILRKHLPSFLLTLLTLYIAV
ncbi:MAG: RNA polymerase sigma-70 factor [Bacteroidota bacterium]